MEPCVCRTLMSFWTAANARSGHEIVRSGRRVRKLFQNGTLLYEPCPRFVWIRFTTDELSRLHGSDLCASSTLFLQPSKQFIRRTAPFLATPSSHNRAVRDITHRWEAVSSIFPHHRKSYFNFPNYISIYQRLKLKYPTRMSLNYSKSTYFIYLKYTHLLNLTFKKSTAKLIKLSYYWKHRRTYIKTIELHYHCWSTSGGSDLEAGDEYFYAHWQAVWFVYVSVYGLYFS